MGILTPETRFNPPLPQRPTLPASPCGANSHAANCAWLEGFRGVRGEEGPWDGGGFRRIPEGCSGGSKGLLGPGRGGRGGTQFTAVGLAPTGLRTLQGHMPNLPPLWTKLLCLGSPERFAGIEAAMMIGRRARHIFRKTAMTAMSSEVPQEHTNQPTTKLARSMLRTCHDHINECGQGSQTPTVATLRAWYRLQKPLNPENTKNYEKNTKSPFPGRGPKLCKNYRRNSKMAQKSPFLYFFRYFFAKFRAPTREGGFCIFS